MVATKRKLKQNNREISPIKIETKTQDLDKTQTQDYRTKSEETNNGRFSGSLKYILLVIFVPAFLNHAALFREAIGLKPPGELYDIGRGQKLFMSCMGNGQPTVILDAPTGQSSDSWTLIAPAVAKTTRVCFYDRAGLGFSDRPYINKSAEKTQNRGHPSTTERMVDDFHRLFKGSSSQSKPFILVGAELGAVNARFYAQLFEEDVSALVLINPLIEGLFTDPDDRWTNAWLSNHISSYQILQFSAAVGISRLGFIFGLMRTPVDEKLVSKDVVARQKYFMCKPAHLSSAVDEYYFANESLSQMRTLSKFKRFNPGRIGITVLTSSTYNKMANDPLNKEWTSTKLKIEKFYSPGIELRTLPGSADLALLKNAKTIINVIVGHVNKWRKVHSNQKGKAQTM